MSHPRRPRLAILAAAAGTVLLLAAAPSLAQAPDPTAPGSSIPDLRTIGELLQEPRPGTAGIPRQSPGPVPAATPSAPPAPSGKTRSEMPQPETAQAQGPAASPAQTGDEEAVTWTPGPDDRATSGVYWSPDADGEPAYPSPVPTAAPSPAPSSPAPPAGTTPPAQSPPESTFPPMGPPRSPAATPSRTPTPAPTTTPIPTPDPTAEPEPEAPSPAELTARVIELTNVDRAKAGCRPLVPQVLLAEAAQGHAEDMSRRVYFSHTSLDGRTFDQRIRDSGYRGRELGENIASGFPTAEEVQEAWMHTPGHRRNILDCSFREIGVGYVDEGQFWVVNFGG